VKTRREPAKAQATATCYELHTLGWKAFQNLCATIVGEVFGQTVQSFFDSRDGGRDGAFQGIWKPTGDDTFAGSFTVQSKFSAKAGKHLALTDVKSELAKAARLAKRGLADNYLLFTNSHVTGTTDEALRQAFTAIPGINRFASFGLERITQIIRESSRLRMLVPRVYGLGDLSQIFDERAYAQAREILSALGDDLGKFVITDAYRRSATAVIEHGFVLLLGEAACGKSTIAAALAVGAIDEWGCSTLKVRDADEFVAHSNPHEPKQFFWVDDAFGATQCDWQCVAAWNRVFPHINAAIKRGARVLFTSRDYIYRAARRQLKETAFPVIRESQVVIHVERLASTEREQILYNHVRLGSQPTATKTRLKPFLPGVAAHDRFSPEIARRLGNPMFTKDLIISKEHLDDFVEHPLELLCEIIRNLDAESRTALALVFMRGGALASPITLEKDEEEAVELMGGSRAGVREALGALDEGLVLRSLDGGSYYWRFKHPTIRDAFASLVAEDRELMDIYLTGTPLARLFEEVSCGHLEIPGVKVVVPQDRYEALIARMKSLSLARDEDKGVLHRFLRHRCDNVMLALFVERNPHFIASLRVGSYLYAVSDVGVLVRLHEFGLLPEEKRAAVVADIRDLAVSTPDPGFQDQRYRGMFTDDEFRATLDDVRQKLIPRLDDEISNWRWNYRSDDDPDSYFDELVSALKKYRETFAADSEATKLLDEGLGSIERIVEELRSELPQEPDSDDFRAAFGADDENDGERSVFEDVDE